MKIFIYSVRLPSRVSFSSIQLSKDRSDAQINASRRLFGGRKKLPFFLKLPLTCQFAENLLWKIWNYFHSKFYNFSLSLRFDSILISFSTFFVVFPILMMISFHWFDVDIATHTKNGYFYRQFLSNFSKRVHFLFTFSHPPKPSNYSFSAMIK